MSERASGYHSCAPLAHLPEALVVWCATLLPELAPFPFGCAAGRLLRCHRAGPSTSLDKKCFIYLFSCAPNGNKCANACQKHGRASSIPSPSGAVYNGPQESLPVKLGIFWKNALSLKASSRHSIIFPGNPPCFDYVRFVQVYIINALLLKSGKG